MKDGVQGRGEREEGAGESQRDGWEEEEKEKRRRRGDKRGELMKKVEEGGNHIIITFISIAPFEPRLHNALQ